MTFLDIANDFLEAVTSELDPYTSKKGVIELDEANNRATLFTPSHIQFAKYGRGPGKQPPLDSILDWVTNGRIQFRKDNGQFMSYEGTSWAIARSIAKKGTKNYVPNAPNAMEQAIEDNIQEFFDKVNSNLVEVQNDAVEKIWNNIFPQEIEFKI